MDSQPMGEAQVPNPQTNNSGNQGSDSKPYKLDPNIEATLSYVLSILSGVFVLMMEKHNKFVRFHAMQSVIFGLAWFVLSIVVSAVPLLGGLVSSVMSLAWVAIWFLLMYKAYNNEEYQLPIIGKIAKDQVEKLG